MRGSVREKAFLFWEKYVLNTEYENKRPCYIAQRGQAGASSINVNGSTSHSECEYPTTIEPGVCFVAADNTDLTAHLAAEP